MCWWLLVILQIKYSDYEWFFNNKKNNNNYKIVCIKYGHRNLHRNFCCWYIFEICLSKYFCNNFFLLLFYFNPNSSQKELQNIKTLMKQKYIYIYIFWMDDVKFFLLIQMSKVLFCSSQHWKHEYKYVQCLDTGMFQA